MDVLREKLPNCQQTHVLGECGHAINLDKPDVFAKIMLEFWTQQQKPQTKCDKNML